MLNKILKRIIIITTLSILLSVALSLSAFNYIINNQAKQSLTNYSDFVSQQLKQLSSKEELLEFLSYQNKNAICITILNSDYELIADNNTTNLKVVDYKSEKFFLKAYEGMNNFKIGIPYVDGNSMLMYTTRVSDIKYFPSEIVLIRYSAYIVYNNKPFWFLIVFSTLIWGLIVLISYITINNSIKTAYEPLVGIQHSLEAMCQGKYLKPVLNNNIDAPEFYNIFNSISDVSEKIAQHVGDLRVEQQKSNFLLQSISQGIIAVSNKGKIILTNNAILKIFGKDISFLGVGLDYLFEDEELLSKIQNSIDKHSYFAGNLELNSNIYRVETFTTDTPYSTEFGGIAMMVILTDITQESKSTGIRSDFFANASHELKTPLTAIRGFSEILSITKDPVKIQKCANEINNNALKMLNLIDDMLKLSRLNAKIDIEEISKFNLGELCNKVCEEQSVTASAKNISITCNGEAEIFARKNMITMMVSNLLNNAIKYNKQNGTIHIDIDKNNDKINLSIKDSGIGIAQDQQGRLFERFYMVDSGRSKTNQHSSGLGLSIVKSIVLLHEGKIELSSKLGEGTRIIIELPAL